MVETAPRALVTGAAGFLGARVRRALTDAGWEARGTIRPGSARADEGAARLLECDVRDRAALRAAASGCQVVFHVASTYAYHGHSRQELESVAVDGVLAVLEAARDAECRRVVLTGSSVIFGASGGTVPLDERGPIKREQDVAYFAAKARQASAALERADRLGIELLIACPTLCMGPNDRKLGPSNAVLVSYLKDPFRTTFPGGCNVAHVDDVAAAHVLLAGKGEPGSSYLLGGENLEWSLLHRMTSELVGLNGPLNHANRTASYLAAATAEWLASLTGTTPLSTRAQASTVGRYYWYSHERAAALGYAPRRARSTLASALAWLVTSQHVPRALATKFRLSREVMDQSLAAEET